MPNPANHAEDPLGNEQPRVETASTHEQRINPANESVSDTDLPASDLPANRTRDSDPAHSDSAHSGSLDLALQQTEIKRAELLLKVLIAAIALAVARNAAGGTVLIGTTYRLTLVVLLVGVLYAFAVRLFTSRAVSEGRRISDWVYAATTALETLIPTSLLVIRMMYSSLSDIGSTHSPSMLYYCILAVVSVLRLRPLLCILGGLLCSIQHAGLIGYAVWNTNPPIERGLLPLLFSYPILILLAWVCAAFVAQHIREQVLTLAKLRR